VANDPNCFSGAERDLLCGKTFVVDKFDRPPLPGLEKTQSLLNEHPCFNRRISGRTLGTIRKIWQKFVE
jgi:hypothetical protein